MSFVIYVVIAALVVVGLAILVVNYVPKDKHWIVSLILLILIIFLGYKIVASIMKPIKFAEEKKDRYAKVIDNLKMIRDAEIAYNRNYRKYTADKNELISFIDTGRFPIVKVTTKPKKVRSQRGGNIYITIDERIETLQGYKAVKDGFKDRDYKNMFKVPGTATEFDLKVDSIMKIEGLMSSLFEAKVDKAIVLAGMDDYLIEEEKRSLGGTEVKGPFISVGSLEDIKVNGNWPPLYDGKKNKE